MSKRKGSGGGFGGLVLRHGEKVLFGAVVLLLLGSVVMAMSHQSVEATPDQISQAARSAKRAVETADQNFKPPAAQEIIREVQKADVRVDFIPYELSRTPVPGQVSGDMKKRGAPKIFPIRDLKITPGNGSILVWREETEEDSELTTGTMQVAGTTGPSGYSSGPSSYSGGPSMGPGMSGVSGGAEPKTVSWICVTGVIDYQKQMEEYSKCFDEVDPRCRYPDRDIYPAYSYLVIERAEVAGGGEPQWKEIDMVAAYEPPFVDWVGFSVEAADPPMTMLGIPFVYPLPQLSGGKWGSEVAHEPEIPLMDYTSRQYTMGGFGMQQQTTTTKSRGKKVEETKTIYDPKAVYDKLMENQNLLRRYGGMSGSSMGTGGSYMGGGPGMSSSYGGSSMSGGAGSDARLNAIRNYTSAGRSPSGMGGYMGSGPGMNSSYGGSSMGSGYGPGSYGGAGGMYNQPEEFQLFRFMDFTIEHGKSYQYRVRLEVENPNWQIPVDYLEDGTTGEDEYLLSAWSDGTDSVAVVGDSRIILGTVDPDDRAELSANPTLVLVRTDEDTGQEQLHRVQPKLGQYLNLSDAEVKPPQTMNRGGAMTGPGAGSTTPYSGGPGPKPAKKTADFVTDRLVVGLSMGPKLDTSKGMYYGASEVLLMDPSGRMTAIRENDDEAEYLRYFPNGRAVIPEQPKQSQQPVTSGRGGY